MMLKIEAKVLDEENWEYKTLFWDLSKGQKKFKSDNEYLDASFWESINGLQRVTKKYSFGEFKDYYKLPANDEYLCQIKYQSTTDISARQRKFMATVRKIKPTGRNIEYTAGLAELFPLVHSINNFYFSLHKIK